MTKLLGLKPYLIAMIFCCLLPQLFALIAQKEIFPWSSFPMYSGADTGKNLVLLSAYVVGAEGSETPIERTSILRAKYEYRTRIDAELAWTRTLNAEEKETLERFANIFKDDLVGNNQNYLKVRFYLEYWKDFAGPRRYSPDERRMIFEYPLN